MEHYTYKQPDVQTLLLVFLGDLQVAAEKKGWE